MTSKELNDIIYTLLYGDSAVRAVVGDSIFPNVATQGLKSTKPYLVYHIGATKTERAFLNSTVYYKIGIGAYAISYSRCNDLMEKVKSKLDRFRGLVNGTFVNSIYYEEEGDGLIEAPALHHRQAMFIVNVKL